MFSGPAGFDPTRFNRIDAQPRAASKLDSDWPAISLAWVAASESRLVASAIFPFWVIGGGRSVDLALQQVELPSQQAAADDAEKQDENREHRQARRFAP